MLETLLLRYCVCIDTVICTYVCMYMYKYLCAFDARNFGAEVLCVYRHCYMYVCLHVYVCLYARCRSTRSIYVYMYTYIYIYIYICTRKVTYTTHIHIYASGATYRRMESWIGHLLRYRRRSHPIYALNLWITTKACCWSACRRIRL
jgi:hypothetical protein